MPNVRLLPWAALGAWKTVARWLNEHSPFTAVNALELRCSNFGSMVPAAEDQSCSSSIAEAGVASSRRRGVAGIEGRTSSILIGESDIEDTDGSRFRSLHAAIMDSGDAQRLDRHDGARD